LQNQTKTSRANESYAKAGSVVYETVSSIRTILSLNAIEQVIASFQEATQEAYVGAVSQVVYLGIANGSVMASFLLGYLPLILYGAYLLYTGVGNDGCDPSGAISSNQSCDPSAFDVFGALMGITFAGAVVPQIGASLECFVGARSACYPALVAINRKRDGSESTPSSTEDTREREGGTAPVRRGSTVPLPRYLIDSSSPDGLKPKGVVGHVAFNDVGFRYPSRQEVKVFDGFNLDIKAGTTVALVGASGGGKSTVVQLLERFYDPTSGSVTLDGIDLKDLNLKWLRQHIGLVSQEPKLFAASILDNIRMGRPEATIEDVHDAAKKVCAARVGGTCRLVFRRVPCAHKIVDNPLRPQSNCHDFIMSFGKGKIDGLREFRSTVITH
jgi:ATP-binding cassette, subfamily B (MDR/TAP), member 1